LTDGHHEFVAHVHKVETSSDRSFGLIVGGVLIVFAGYSYWRNGHWWLAFGSIGFVLIVLGLLWPSLLAPLNRLWTKLGTLLGKIVPPIVLGILFFAVVTPIGLLARAVGKDFLALKRNSKASTFWILRDPPGPPAKTMHDQF
jgi:hypothetical protein